MKKIAIITLSLLIALSGFAQEDETNIDEMKTALENQKNDTTNIRFKRKTVKIVEDDDETQQIFDLVIYCRCGWVNSFPFDSTNKDCLVGISNGSMVWCITAAKGIGR